MSVPAAFDSVKGHNRDLIRKFLEMAIFVKPRVKGTPVTPPTKIYTTSDGLIVPTGLLPVGLTTKSDGATWTRDQTVEDVESYGYSTPTRRDIVRDVRGLAFTMQESKKLTMEMYNGISLEGKAADTDGNVFFDVAAIPQSRRWEVYAIGKDGNGPDAVYCLRYLPDAEITENAEQAWKSDTEIQYPATLTAYVDEEVGTAMREIWGGPGLDVSGMGFTA